MTLGLMEKTVVTVTSTTVTEKYSDGSSSKDENDTNESRNDDSTNTTEADADTDESNAIDTAASGPDMTDNRNPNGDVTLPYRYQKNGWDIEFDLDEQERITSGRFLLKITPYSTPNGAMPETKLVLENLLLDGKKKFNIYDGTKNTYLAIGKQATLGLEENFSDRKYQYSIGDWGDNSYIYLFVEGKDSGVFYIFPKDSGANYIRT